MTRNGKWETLALGPVVFDGKITSAAFDDAIKTAKTRVWRHGIRGRVWGFRGVPVRRAEIVVGDNSAKPADVVHDDRVWLCEVGRYEEKISLAFFPVSELPTGLARHMKARWDAEEEVVIAAEPSADGSLLHLSASGPRIADGPLRWRFRVYEAEWDASKNAHGLAVYVWTRWFSHLKYDDVRPYIEGGVDAYFRKLPPADRSDALRRVSRDLYRLSRAAGWTKVTRQMAERWGVTPGAQWVRTEIVDIWRRAYHEAKNGESSQNIGDYTLWAAVGGPERSTAEMEEETK